MCKVVNDTDIFQNNIDTETQKWFSKYWYPYQCDQIGLLCKKDLVTNTVTKVAQIFGKFFGYFGYVEAKTAMSNFCPT